VTGLHPSGPGRRVCEIATRLDREKFEVSVVALHGGPLAETLEGSGVAVTVLRMRSKLNFTRMSKLAGLLRDFQADLVHTHQFHADFAGRPAARLAAVPNLVHTVHVAEGRFRPWQFAYARFLSGYCDRIVCVSPAVRLHHSKRSGLPDSMYTVIPSGIDAEVFTQDPADRGRLRGQWGIDDSRPVIAFIGRLDRQKGIETLLSAMSHLAGRGQAMDVVIAGDGPRRHLVENFIRYGEGGNRCRLLGFVDDVRAVFSAADIFTTTSNWEGHPLATSEAMAAGLPVVATRAPGLGDLVTDGVTGLLADCGDTFGIAERIEQLAGDAKLRKRLGRAGRQCIVENYPVSAMVEAIEKLYMEVTSETLANRPRRIDADWDE